MNTATFALDSDLISKIKTQPGRVAMLDNDADISLSFYGLQCEYQAREDVPSNVPSSYYHQVIRYAAVPDFTTGRNPYETALALARVSSEVRRMAMPGFLHTVVICSMDQLRAFIRAIHRSRSNGHLYPRLALQSNYSGLVRRFWCSEAPHRLIGETEVLDYVALYNILRNVDSLGMTFSALPMLSDCLAEGKDIQKEWKCRRLTLVGPAARWNPLASTSDGLACLSKITHLVVYDTQTTDEPSYFPAFIRNVPFSAMPRLTHFAFPTLSSPRGRSHPMVVYEASGGMESRLFRRWVTAPNPASYGTMVPINAPRQAWYQGRGFDWSAAFGMAEQEQLWPRAEAERERQKRKVKK